MRRRAQRGTSWPGVPPCVTLHCEHSPVPGAHAGALQARPVQQRHCASLHLWVPGRAKAVRAARQAGASAKRRKMMADLDARERVWKAERSEEDIARAKLKVWLLGAFSSACLARA